VIGLDALYASYIERRRIPRVVSALKRGSADIKVVDEDPYFSRPKEEAEVTPLVKASRGGFYNLVTGEHGTGKTTLVRHVCRQVGSGVIYTRVPEDITQLARDVSATISFDLEHSSLVLATNSPSLASC